MTTGEALEGVTEEVLVATQGRLRRSGPGPPRGAAGADRASLRSLRTEAIGLYDLHRVDADTPLEESLGAIQAYVDRGAIRHVGVSEVSVEQIERARAVVPIAAVRNRYNLADRRHDDVVDHCAREGIAFVPSSPLRGDDGADVAAAAERLGATENAVKLAWLLRRSPVVLPIPGRCRSSTCARTSRRSSSSSTRTRSRPSRVKRARRLGRPPPLAEHEPALG